MIGMHVGQYRLLELLGEGAWGACSSPSTGSSSRATRSSCSTRTCPSARIGRPLRQVIAGHGEPLPPHRIARLIDDVLHALHAAHERLFVHRDMKPDNIMVSPVDDPDLVEKATVLDFGVARLGPGAEVVTLAGAVIGTPQYMAPEQLRGSAVDLGLISGRSARSPTRWRRADGSLTTAGQRPRAISQAPRSSTG